MRKLIFLVTFLSLSEAGFTQSLFKTELRNGKTIESFSVTGSGLESGPGVFFDAEYGIQAYSFILSKDPGQFKVISTFESGKTSDLTEINLADELIDGNPELKKETKRKTISQIPLFSVTPVTLRGKKFFHLIIRPWVVKPDKIAGLETIEFSASNPGAVFSVQTPEQIRALPVTTTSKLQKEMTTGSFDKTDGIVYRLLFNKSGLGRITWEDLKSADPVALFNNTETSRIKVFSKGEEIPVLIQDGGDGLFGEGDAVEFFCDQNKISYSNPKKDIYFDPFTDYNAYFLVFKSSDPGKNRLGILSGELKESIGLGDERNLLGRSFPANLHFEENKQFDQLSKVDTTRTIDFRDHWFWAAIPLNEQKSFPLTIPGQDPLGGNYHIRMALHGLTYTKNNGFEFEHNLKVDIGNAIRRYSLGIPESGTDKWTGQELNIVSFTLPGQTFSSYMSGQNTAFSIQNYDPKYSTLSPGRQFALNWIEINYYRLYKAEGNYLSFSLPENVSPSTYQFVLDNFSDPGIEVYKKGVGKLTNFSVESYLPSGSLQTTKLYRILFQDYVVNPASTEYLALTPGQKIKPGFVGRVSGSVLLDTARPLLSSPDRDESLIIIAADKFWNYQNYNSSYNPVRSFAESRESDLQARAQEDSRLTNRRHQVLITSVSDVYDEFSAGNKSPYGIRAFLQYAVSNWARPPLYVLLVGDASLNYKSDKDLIPTMNIQTVEYGSASADAWYAMLDGNDIIPDIALGRLPVTTPDEISAYLEKVKGYQAENSGSGWKNNTLFISGFEDSFISDNDTLRNLASKNFFNDVLHIKEKGEGDPFFGGKSQLINFFNKGQLLVNFMGHGGGGIWADRGLFDIPDADRLAPSSKLPFVSSLTCYTGSFAESKTSLMEKLVLVPQKGAIAGLGSSGVGWKKNNRYLGESMFRYLLNSQYKVYSIAELVDMGKFYYRLQYSDYGTYPFMIPNSQIYQYNFLGDPSIRLRFPDELLKAENPRQLLSGNDSVSVELALPEINANSVMAKFSDILGRDIYTASIETQPVNGNQVKFKTAVPPVLAQKQGYLKYYVPGTPTDRAGSVFFSFSKVLFDSVTSVNSGQPERKPLKLKAHIQASVPIETGSIQIEVRDEAEDSGVTGNKVYGKVGKLADTEPLFTKQFSLLTNGDGWWAMTDTIPGEYVRSGYKIRYHITLRDNQNRDYFSDGIFSLSELPDVSAAPQIPGIGSEYYTNKSIDFYYVDGPRIGALVYNPSTLDVDKVWVKFYNGSVVDAEPPYFSGTPVLLGKTETSLKRNSSKMVFIPLPAESVMAPGASYQLAIQVEADTTGGLREKSYTNNLSKPNLKEFNIYEVGKDKRQFVSLNSFKIDFSSLTDKAISVLLKKTGEKQINNQPKLQPVEMGSYIDGGILVAPFGPVQSNQLPAPASMLATASKSIENPEQISFFRLDSKSGKWIRIPSAYNPAEKVLSCTIRAFGEYRVLRSDDSEPPIVNISVNGNLLSNGGAVPVNGEYSFVVQDDNGVSLDPEIIRMEFDGVAVPASELTVPDTLSDGNQMLVTLRKQLSPGLHTLSYSFADAIGNSLEIEELEFTASNKEDFIFYGGFPNPFSNYQIFTFFLNSEATKAQLKIYTVSGKLINQYNSADVSGISTSFIPDDAYSGLRIVNSNDGGTFFGYREIFWDGTDKDGYPVANGVYFIKLIISFKDGKSMEKIFKSARYN